MSSETQKTPVIKALRPEGGFATLGRLNENIGLSTRKTRTPEASVRRIVWESKDFFNFFG